MLTTQRILQLAPIAQYLASNAVQKGALFTPPIDPKKPITIFMVYKILKKIYDIDPDYPNIDIVAKYLWELIFPWTFRAAAIYDNNTGGQIAPPTPSGGTLPNPYDFEITPTSAPLADGESSVILTNFIGYNVIFNRSNVPQSTINTGGTYFSWNRVTGQFQCFPAAITGEIFTIMPVG